MLTKLDSVLKPAQNAHYAVPAFDCVTDVLVRSILDKAEELRSPVILMALENDLKGKGMAYISALIRNIAPYYTIPVVLHLDHAEELDLIKRALDHGFTSVMYDGSTLAVEENIHRTAAVVELAKKYDASTEAELGRVAGFELGGADTGEAVLTDPQGVADFVAATHVDALAVSIGTAHGIYVSTPNLHQERLSEIRAASDVPLVLHGGSGTPEDQVAEAIRRGITKINIYADLRIAMGKGFDSMAGQKRRPDPLPDQLFCPMYEEVMAAVGAKINMCMSAGRV